MTKPAVLPQAVYRRRRDPGDLPSDLRLRALEWALYFAVDAKRPVAELARQMRAEAADRDEAFARLLAFGLIEEQELAATEYVQALAAAGDREEKTLREFLAGAPVPVRAPAPAPARPRLAPAFQPLPLPSKEHAPMSAPRSLSLRALMNVIEKRAGTREAGQLDIYRVFVRVDTVLLRRNGIESLRFTEDRLVADPELQQSIVRSVKKTLGLECPPSVWVDVA